MDNYLLFNKENKITTLFSIILILIVAVTLNIIFFYKFEFHSSYNGIVLREENEYYVSIILSDNELKKIKKNLLIVDKEKINYEIEKISEEYVLTETGPKRLVYIKINLKDEEKIINNVVELNFTYKDTLYKKLKEML